MATADAIAVPTLLINGLDDPYCAHRIPALATSRERPLAASQSLRGAGVAENIDYDLHKRNPRILLATTRRGSHLAFYTGLWAESWAERAALQFLKAAREREVIQTGRWQGGAVATPGNGSRAVPQAND